MIQNFEKYTAHLTPYEQDVLTPMVAKYLQTRVGSKNAIRNKDICHAFGVQGYQGLKEARMRKVVNSHGYYCATSIPEVESYCDSLYERAMAILSIRQALKFQLSGKLFID